LEIHPLKWWKRRWYILYLLSYSFQQSHLSAILPVVELCTEVDTSGEDDTGVLVAGNTPSEVAETPVVYTVFSAVVISAISSAVEMCSDVDNKSTPGIDDTCVVAGNTLSEVVETSVVYSLLAVVVISEISNLAIRASSGTLLRRLQ
jgi:hypothetical protein